MHPIAVSTSGYAYEDWRSILYPQDLAKARFLEYYALVFPFVELNFSYYRMPSAGSLRAMAARTPTSFRFAIKAHATLTHQVGVDWLDQARLFRQAVEVLAQEDRLVTILFQFPYSFHHSPDNRQYLDRLLHAFTGLPLAVEFRNDQWGGERVYSQLDQRGVATVMVDRPDLPGLPVQSEQVTGSFAYLRFHGRNAGQWWRGDNVSRYDYLYSDEELRLSLGRLRAMAKKAHLWVAFNNHAGGKAVANARSLRQMLDESRA